MSGIGSRNAAAYARPANGQGHPSAATAISNLLLASREQPPQQHVEHRRERQTDTQHVSVRANAKRPISEPENTATDSQTLLSKPKRQRKTYNCEPCRRLKTKCDRQVPCDHCIKGKREGSCSYNELNSKSGRIKPNRQRSVSPPTITTVSSPSHDWLNEDLEQHLQQDGNGLTEHVYQRNRSYNIDPSVVVAPTTPKQDSALGIPLPTTSSIRESGGGGIVSDMIAQQRSETSTSAGPHVSFAATFPKRRTSDADERSYSDEDDAHGRGTLTIGEDGRARYIGPTGGSEWLQEPDDAELPTPFHALPKGAEAVGQTNPPASYPLPSMGQAKSADMFPFNMPAADALSAYEAIWQQVPDEDDAQALIDCYYRHFSWNYNVIARPAFNADKEAIYKTARSRNGLEQEPTTTFNPHTLAVFFAVLAMGTQLNLELPLGDATGNHYIALAQQCLSIGRFLTKSTLRAVQALHLMAHFFLCTDPRGDSSWPLWGLSMRMIEAMGMHRDGSGWGLSDSVIEERRRVFWECQCADVFQANCFSRPSSLHPDYIDTQFPADEDGPNGLEGFKTLKFKLAQLSSSVLHQVMKVQRPSHSKVDALFKEICEFERQLPFYIRCRPAWMVLIDLSRKPDDTLRETPEVKKRDFKLTFQQHMLALNISEAIIFLQRPYFTRAICQSSGDPMLSKFASSLIAVFERCIATIAITRSLYSLYPAVIIRHWNFWYHTFTAAVCLSSLITMSPTCILSPFAMGELQSVVTMFSSTPPGSRPRNNLASVVRLQRTAEARLTGKDPAGDPMGSQMAEMFGYAPSILSSNEGTGEEDEQLAMIGWTTRLVRRLKSGFHERGVSIPNIKGHPVQVSPTSDPGSNAGPSSVGITQMMSRETYPEDAWMMGSGNPAYPQGVDAENEAAMSALFDSDAFLGMPSGSFASSTMQQLQQPLDLEMLAGWGLQSGWFQSG